MTGIRAATTSTSNTPISSRLADMHRDKEFQMFWANSEVIKPSSTPSRRRPVVTPKFKDRRPVYQAAIELAERCCDRIL